MIRLSTLVYFLCSLACARVLSKTGVTNDILAADDWSNTSMLHAKTYTDKISYIQRRATRSKCSPPIYRASYYKRYAGGLVRRMILPQHDEMDTFMVDEMANDDTIQIVWQKYDGKDKDGNKLWSDTNTADFQEFKEEAFSMGTSHLKGCTVLAIISRKAVYMAHYWEDPSFEPTLKYLSETGMSEEQIFESTVIKGLKEGINKGGRVEQVSLKNQASRIDDEHIQVYLMRPSTDSDGMVDPYQEEWGMIRDTVEDIFPRLVLLDRPYWHDIIYDPVEEENKEEEERILSESARGRCLFKYDPNHHPNATGIGSKKAMFWTEGIEVAAHNDNW